MRAIVTGGRSGIGAAIVEALERDGADVEVLDLSDGFDVAEPAAWERVEAPIDAAFLNAGVLTGEPDVTRLTDDAYRRILRTNLDGVVFGTRELARRLMPRGGTIVVTASLAGLTDMVSDPIYGLTKHGVVGFMRSVAPQLAERGIRINAVCPGPVDTPMVGDDWRTAFPDVELIPPALVAEGALRALQSEGTGEAWVVQPNRIELFRYPGVPGPR